MLIFLFAATAAAQPADPAAISSALTLCRPKLEAKLKSKIATIDVDNSLASGGWTIIRGPLTAFLGMGKPETGHASTDHLIRAQYDFICWVNDTKVEKTVINPKQ